MQLLKPFIFSSYKCLSNFVSNLNQAKYANLFFSIIPLKKLLNLPQGTLPHTTKAIHFYAVSKEIPRPQFVSFFTASVKVSSLEHPHSTPQFCFHSTAVACCRLLVNLLSVLCFVCQPVTDQLLINRLKSSFSKRHSTTASLLNTYIWPVILKRHVSISMFFISRNLCCGILILVLHESLRKWNCLYFNWLEIAVDIWQKLDFLFLCTICP